MCARSTVRARHSAQLGALDDAPMRANFATLREKSRDITVAPALLIIRRMIGKDDELKDRIQARKHAMQAKLDELKADGRKEARSTTDKLKKSLDELEDSVKDGWDNLSDAVRTKLNSWLDRNP